MRKTILFSFIFLLTVVTVCPVTWAQTNSQLKWQHQTPQGNTLRWVKMWDANNWYALGYGGTFMKTTDGGSTWDLQTLINGLDAGGGYDWLYDGHFLNANTGFACGQAGKFLKTTNAGATWDTSTAISTAVTWYGMQWLNATTGFLAGTSSGRVAMTTDGGTTWSQVGTPPSGTYYSVHARDVNNIIASSTSGNIRKTTNGGTSWTTVSTGGSATLYQVKFVDANTGYVSGSSSTVRMTTDFGTSWTDLETGAFASSTFYDLDFLSSSLPAPTLDQDFTSVTFPPTGWTRANLLGTKQWSRSTTNAHSSPACALSDWETSGGVDWLVTNANAVFGGDSLSFWIRRSYTGAFFDWDSLQIYAGTSTDTSSMTKMLSIGVNDLIDTTGSTYPPRVGGPYKRYAVDMSSLAGPNVFIGFRHSNLDGTGIRMDDVILGENRPASQTTVYLTGNAFNIYKAPLGTTAWDTVQFLDPTQAWTSTFYNTDFTPSGDTLLTVGGSGLINARYSPSSKITYTNYIKAGTLYDIWAENGYGRVIAVGAPGIANSVYDQVMYSTNGGNTWSIGNYSATDDQDINSISMINSLTGYVAGDEGNVHKTTDGGATWTATTDPGTTTELEKAVFLNENTGYVFGDDGNDYKTTNGGTSWTPYVSGHGTSDIYGASFIDVNTGWTVGQSGKVYMTTDGGTTTTSQNAETSGTIYDVQMLNATTGWLSSTTGRVRRTTDGGTNWDTVNVPFSATMYSVRFVDQWNGMATSSVGRAFRTRDGGDSWEFDNTSAGTVYQVYMTSTDTAFLCTSNAGIFKYSELLTGSGTFTNSIPDKYYLAQNYPNPFNPSTTISFGLPREGVVSLKIYDIAGREVANIFNSERLNPGVVTYTFNGSTLASGIYFYSLIVDNNIVDTKKMVLVK